MEWSEILRRRTFAFALAVVRFCRTLPHSAEGDVFRRQLLKAGTSVGANYRASCRGRTGKEKQAKLGIVLEEVDEVTYWLELLAAVEMGDREVRKSLLTESGELTALFAASLRTQRLAISREPPRRSTPA